MSTTLFDMPLKTLQRRRHLRTNAFCPTGPGGGQDNSCSPKSGGGGKGAALKDAVAASRATRASYEKAKETADEVSKEATRKASAADSGGRDSFEAGRSGDAVNAGQNGDHQKAADIHYQVAKQLLKDAGIYRSRSSKWEKDVDSKWAKMDKERATRLTEAALLQRKAAEAQEEAASKHKEHKEARKKLSDLTRTDNEAGMEYLAINFAGKVRREKLHNREYLVAPLTMIVPGVLNGSQGALFYPPNEIKKNASAWNGIPLTVGHPTRNGQQLSGRDPSVINETGIGHVYRVSTKNGKLQGEGWFDVEAVKKVDNRIYDALLNGRKIELSTGLFTENHPASRGASFNGKSYTHIARNYRPDHLAILPDQVGACSVNDGCGVNVNSSSDQSAPATVCKCGGTCDKCVAAAENTVEKVEEVEEKPDTTNQAKQAIWNEFGKLIGIVPTGNAAPPQETKTVPASTTSPKVDNAEYAKSYNDRQSELQTQLNKRFPPPKGSMSTIWVSDLYDDYLVYQKDGLYYRLGYVEKDGNCILSKDKPVRVDRVTTYEEVENAFCPTGEGGGVDSSCSPGEGSGRKDDGKKLSISKASKALEKLGYKIVGAGKYDLKSRTASYKVRDKEGKEQTMTSHEIKQLISKSRTNNTYSNQPKSLVSGRWKRPNAGTGKGEAHEAAQRGALYLDTDDYAKGALAKAEIDAGHNPPSWVEDDVKWIKATTAANKGEYDADTLWAVVTHIYKQMGGKIKGDTKQTKNSSVGNRSHSARRQRSGTKPTGVLNMKRDDVIDSLVTNCDCFDEEDRDTLNSLDDKKLKRLHHQLVDNALYEDEEEDPEEEEMMEEEEAPVKKKPGGFFQKNRKTNNRRSSNDELADEIIRNRKKPQTADEWFATAPPEIQSAVRNAMTLEQQAKKGLLDQLTANVADDQIQKVLNQLKSKSIDELKDLLSLLPPARAIAAPSFIGASVPGPNYTGNERALDKDDDDILPIPTINYQQEYAERASRKAKVS